MEGLLLAQTLGPLRDRLPSARGAWRFAGPHTAVLPLADGSALWFFYRLPHPRVELREDVPSGPEGPASSFQELLAARATGPLLAVHQPGLDRVARLRFAAADGFVPQPAVDLVAELTGRNGNLILLDEHERILGAAREIAATQNRYRQVRSGLPYRPPPPYDKPDPRGMSEQELREALADATPAQVKRRLDGIGPELTETAVRLSGVAPDTRLTGAAADAFTQALARVVADPQGAAQEALGRADVATLRRDERRAADLAVVESHLRKVLHRNRKRQRDGERALSAASEAERLRNEADLLLAHASRIASGASSVQLTDFGGAKRTLELDPSRSVAANAEARYRAAKRRRDRAERALARADELVREEQEIRQRLDALHQWDSETLQREAQALTSRRERERDRGPGKVYRAPHGFEVRVGRSAKENDEITFRLARSLDLWLHAQGFPGSHVLIRTGGREAPHDTVLFAARLAAGHCKAANEDAVPVDVTLRKHVWRVKGGLPGAVHYAHQRTVVVAPSRDPGAAADVRS